VQLAVDEGADCAEQTAARLGRKRKATTKRARNMRNPLGQECSAEMGGGEEDLEYRFFG